MKTHRILFSVVVLCLAVAAPAQAGIRADLSGDAIIDFATTMDLPLMTVGNPGNAPDNTAYGAVDYAYRIGKFEVTAGQYAEFLNAVAATNTYGLYNGSMGVDTHGCKIQRSGSSGSYTYSVAADWEDRPVNYVSWADAVRFANWLTNGMPTGVQDATTTEDGSYDLSGTHACYGPEGMITDFEGLFAALSAVSRKNPEDGGRYYIPSEDEWYKAAYHKNDGPTGNYFDYPTSSDSTPSNDPIDPDPGNHANFTVSWPSDVTIGSPYWRTEVGEFENSESPYETFDMGGNIFEWNEARYEYEGWLRGLRGGAYMTDVGYMLASYHTCGDSLVEMDVIGFRVSEVPEPATLSLLALGACLPLFRGKRRQGLGLFRPRHRTTVTEKRSR